LFNEQGSTWTTMALYNRSTMSVEEYLRLDRNSAETRYEYIDGYVRMLAGGSAKHSTIAVNLTGILLGPLRAKGCRVYNSDLRVRLSESHFVYPDVTVSCDTRDRGEVDMVQYPRVVIEVLSPSAEDYDRGRKFAYYRECLTIQEYVMVNTAYPAIEVCRREKHDLWSFHIYRPGDYVELASLDVRFPVSAAYEDVEFPQDDGHTA
jgi:Uma2 family endonuclease